MYKRQAQFDIACQPRLLILSTNVAFNLYIVTTSSRDRQRVAVVKAGCVACIEDRLTDVAFWKEQLAREMRDMNAEIEHLLERKAVMEKMLFDSQRSLAISEECMLQREKRNGIDQTFDDPEKGLCKVRVTGWQLWCSLSFSNQI